MDRLPDEIILHILPHLSLRDIFSIQLASRRLSSLARDNTLWKWRCFEDSRSEIQRRRQELLVSQEPSLAELRRAAPAFLGAILDTPRQTSTARALASWDPSYPSEQVDFYNDYTQRHAPVSVAWLESAVCESLGVGVLRGAEDIALKALAPLDDGSVCIWSISGQSASRGRITARTQAKVLPVTAGKTASSETGAVDNVSVDSSQQRCYIATFDQLNEIDLHTLQVVRRQVFPFPLTALSEARHPIPLTVGTNSTLHLYDTRVNTKIPNADSTLKCELIGGMVPQNDFVSGAKLSTAHATLPQAGPCSLLHLPDSCDIWVAGRFTSLLNYDRRYWPRIKDTVFSGARLSSLSYLPYPFVPRALDFVGHLDMPVTDRYRVKSGPGITVIAAGEYKGKGSLEMFGLPGLATRPGRNLSHHYRNRQTASRTRLISVCPHGTSLVFSDGDGNLKWVERDGSTLVRQLNINDHLDRVENASGLFIESADATGDIVQKIVPTNGHRDSHGTEDGLLVWTGDGRLGMIGFGPKIAFAGDTPGKSAEDAVQEHKERLYGERMRSALEKHADETRFVKGLGLAMGVL